MKKYPVIDLYKTGQKIKQIMEQQGLSVRDIQEYLGLAAPQSIYHWFGGRNLPAIDNLYALSELLHIPIDEMLCGNRKEKFYFHKFDIEHRLFAYYKAFTSQKAA